jgi:hypothetical protein
LSRFALSDEPFSIFLFARQAECFHYMQTIHYII